MNKLFIYAINGLLTILHVLHTMIFYDGAPPDYLTTKISKSDAKIIISTKLKWGETNSHFIQQTLTSYSVGIHTKYTVFVFLVTDNSEPFVIPDNVRFYRTSLLKSQMVKNEFLLPFVWECQEVPFEPLPKRDLPIVGFCGLVSPSRIDVLRAIYGCPAITSNFIIRDQFWGGRPHAPDLVNDFLENIKTSHFTVCNRGAGNFSMRFYQTLACGRIPVLVNTDMEFPFADEIDWSSIIVVANTEAELIDKIVECWNARDVIAMQRNCRTVFDSYFAGATFFDKVLRLS
jgi:hypothetical protein